MNLFEREVRDGDNDDGSMRRVEMKYGHLIKSFLEVPLIESQTRGRGLLIITHHEAGESGDGFLEFNPTFASIASCSDENLGKLGLLPAAAEMVRDMVRSYNPNKEIAVLIAVAHPYVLHWWAYRIDEFIG